MLWSLGQVYLYKEFMTSLLSIISGPPTLTFRKPSLSVILLSTRHFLHIYSGQQQMFLFSSLKKKTPQPTPKKEKKRICSLILIIKTTEGQDQEKRPLPSSSVLSLVCAIPSFTECTIHFQLQLLQVLSPRDNPDQTETK